VKNSVCFCVNLKPSQKLLLLAGVLSLIFWLFQPLRIGLYPILILNTHLHELCHAAAAILTRGDVEYIRIYQDTSGVTYLRTAAPWITSSAGYVGASVIGMLALLASRTGKGCRATLWTLAAAMLVSNILWVRGEALGWVLGFAWAAGLGACAHYLSGPKLKVATQFAGIQQCLSSAHSVFVILQLAAVTHDAGDAASMQDLTGIPAVVWAVIWCMIGLATLVFGLHKAWDTSEPTAT